MRCTCVREASSRHDGWWSESGRGSVALALVIAAVGLGGCVDATPASPARDAVPSPSPSPTETRRSPAASALPSSSAVATAEGVFVWGDLRRRDGGVVGRDLGWRPVPPAPIAPRVGAAMAWTGDRVLVWGGEDSPRTYGDGAEFLLSEQRGGGCHRHR